MDITARVLISGQASIGPFGSQVFACAGKTDLHLVSTSLRPRLETVDRITSSLAPHVAQFLCSSQGPFLRPGPQNVDRVAQGRSRPAVALGLRLAPALRLARRVSTWPRDHFCRSCAHRGRRRGTVLADIDADHGDRGIGSLRHGVLLILGAPCQLRLLAGQEHGRTIPVKHTALFRCKLCHELSDRRLRGGELPEIPHLATAIGNGYCITRF